MKRILLNRSVAVLAILPVLLLLVLLSVTAAPLPTTAVSRILTHQPATAATSGTEWKAVGFQPEANFGGTVTFVGDLNGDGYDDAVIGADSLDGDSPNQGMIFIYLGSASGLNQTYDISILLGEENSAYGRAIAPIGDLNGDGYADFAAGAPGASADTGLVIIDFGAESGVDLSIALVRFGWQAGEQFGSAIAAGDVNGDGFVDVLIGAPGHSLQTGPGGAAYLYFGGPNGLADQPGWTLVSNQPSSRLGEALTIADFNDDGFADIAVGAPLYDYDLPETGAVFVFYGSPQGLPGGANATPLNANWAVYGWSSFEHFGAALDASGSVNGDSFADLIVGAPGYGSASFPNTTGGEAWGGVYGFWGSETGLNEWDDWFVTEYASGSQFGAAVTIMGDLNQDGYDDVLIGAPQAYFYNGMPDRSPSGEPPPGAAYLYLGDEFGPYYYWDAALSNEEPGSRFGHALAGGDPNGNGFADILVGAPQYAESGVPYGAAYSFAGGGQLVGLTAVNNSPTTLGQPTSFAAFLEDGTLPQFEWYFGDGNYGSGQFVEHTYAQPGVYTATVYAYNPFNSLSADTTVVVNVNSVIDPDTGGSLGYISPAGWGITVTVPGGAVEQPVGLAFIPLNPDEIGEPLPLNPSRYFFDLDPVELPSTLLFLPYINGGGGDHDDDGGDALPGQITAVADTFPFLRPISLTLTYIDSQIPGLDENTLILTYWDGSQWLDAATTCPNPFPYVRDPANNQITLQICHLSRFGMVGN
jgi:hypothetical protein